jgi:phage terminase large subunit-like protein
VVAAESDTVSGKKFIVTLVEELWQFGKRSNAESMLMEATGGMASRDEGAVIYITTESDDAPAGVYKAKNLYARKVRDGEVIDPTFLPVLYEWPKAMVDSGANLDLENAGVVNPNLGASVSAEWLRSKFHEAKEESQKAFQTFVAKHLNVEIGLSLRSCRWAGADFWEAAGAKPVTLPEILQRCDVVTAGVDGGGLDDLLGLCLLGRCAETGDWLHWAHAWAHPIALVRRQSEAARYHDFSADGDLTIVETIGEDVRGVVDFIEQAEEAGLLDRVGVDPAGIGSIVDELVARGIETDRIVGIPQGWKLTGAIKTAERRLAEGAFHHGGRPLMAWSVGNAKVEPRGNAITITKQAAGSGKIDPLMATFNAVALMSMNPEPRRKSYALHFV